MAAAAYTDDVANEQRGVRPCLIASTAPFHGLPIEQALVIPLTTRDRGLPHHVPVQDDGGLTRSSWAMCEGLRAVSTRRFGQLIGTATDQTTDAVAAIVLDWLDAHR